MMKSDVEDGMGADPVEEETDSWYRPAVRRQNRWFGIGVVSLLSVGAVFLLANFYSRPEGSVLGGEAKYDADEGEVGNDALNAKIQKILDQKHGGPHKWNNHPGNIATNGVPGWIHEHHNSTTNKTLPWNSVQQDQDEAEKDDSSADQQDEQDESETEEAETDQQSSEDEEAAWLARTVTLQDGVKYQVVAKLSHDPDAFTQGLTYENGVLYESTGLYGHSSVRRLNPVTGEAQKIVPLVPGHYFGEGMVYLDGKLIQITWKSKKGFVYNANDLSLLEQFDFNTTNGQGWGITHNPSRNELIVTDGTNNLHFWDPKDLGNTRRTVAVTRQDGTPATNLNELEFWRGRVLANVWYQDVLLVIHPDTGKVEKEYDFSQLWPSDKRNRNANVFNGISISADPDVLYVTGKQWSRMYKVKLLA